VTDEATPAEDIASLYGPFVTPDSLDRLLRACEQVEDFRALARRSESARFMVEAIEAAWPGPAKLEDWIVKVTAHYLDALVEHTSSGLLETIAHQDFLLGECHGYYTDYVASECPLRDGSDASEWLYDTGTNSLCFSNTLVRDYFIARHIVDGNSNFLLRFEFPERWVLMFLALLAPGLVSNIAAKRTDRIRAEIESEVEQKVQAALSHQLKRSAGAVRSHLKAIRRKLPRQQFSDISNEFERILQEVDFQIALSERTSKWSVEPELHIEDVSVQEEIKSVIDPLAEAFPTIDVKVDTPTHLISRCDRQLLREALSCLVENAFQAACERPEGERRVEVCARRAEAVLTIRIDVLDSGPGVHPDDRERIFQPRVTTKKGGNGHPLGTGMGLPIARKYAELMGGRVGVDTGAAQTCFFLELPASPETV
jgi:signal transduction histidine kinase